MDDDEVVVITEVPLTDWLDQTTQGSKQVRRRRPKSLGFLRPQSRTPKESTVLSRERDSKRWHPKSGRVILNKALETMDNLFTASFLSATVRSDYRKMSVAAVDEVQDEVTSEVVDKDVELIEGRDSNSLGDAKPRLRKRHKSLTVLGNTQNILVTGGVLTRKEGILELKRMVAGTEVGGLRRASSLFGRGRRRLSSVEMSSMAAAPAISDKRSSMASVASSNRSSSGSGGFKSRASRRASMLMAAMAKAGSRTTKCAVVVEKGNFYFSIDDSVIKSQRDASAGSRLANEVAATNWEVIPIALINDIHYKRGGRSFVLSLTAAPEYGFDQQDIEFRCRTVQSAVNWIEHVLTQIRNQAALTESIADLIGGKANNPSLEDEASVQYAYDAEIIFKRAILLWKLFYGATPNVRVAECLERYATWIATAPLPHGSAEAAEAEVEAKGIRLLLEAEAPTGKKGKGSNISALDEIRSYTANLVMAHLEARRSNRAA